MNRIITIGHVRLNFILEKRAPENPQWKEIQIRRALDDTEKAYRSISEEERKERIEKIQKVFNHQPRPEGRGMLFSSGG
jgi:hypothetical protein